jgi:hypothetical protein
MNFYDVMIILMIVILIIIIGFALCVISFTHSSIMRTRQQIVHNARIHLHIRRSNLVGIEPTTAESSICSSDIDCEMKRGPELV